MNSHDFRTLINQLEQIKESEQPIDLSASEYLSESQLRDICNLLEMDRRAFLGKALGGAGAAMMGGAGIAKLAGAMDDFKSGKGSSSGSGSSGGEIGDNQVPQGYSPREWKNEEYLAMIAGSLEGTRAGYIELLEKKNMTGDKQAMSTVPLLRSAANSANYRLILNLSSKQFDESYKNKVKRRFEQIKNFYYNDSLDAMRFGDVRAEVNKALGFMRQLADAGLFNYQ